MNVNDSYNDYDEFFCKATGFTPFPYQRRWAEGTEFPSLVSIPTGLGKTAGAVLAWLWRRRAHPDPNVRDKTPRRLVYCLPMRVLVEQTRDCCRSWLSNLNLLAQDAPKEHPPDKVATHILMGGDLEIDWDRRPDRDQILIGTQDMLLSRALNRGYAMSRFRWPIQFGLLNNDCLWVMDEVQLMGNGLSTTTQLQAFRRKLGMLSPVRSIWMSATMRSDWLNTVDFDPNIDAHGNLELLGENMEHEEIRRRFKAPKPLEKASFEASKNGKLEAELAIGVHRSGSLTMVVVNTVGRAAAIYKELQKKKPPAELVLIHSRFRLPDRERQIGRLLDEPGEVGTIAITTQVVEAGVDVSAASLITDLAPWSSLVQRFGRCNRKGGIPSAHVIWIASPNLHDAKKLNAAPYEPEELRSAAVRLSKLSDVGLQSLPAFEEGISYNHVIRQKDLIDLFDTTPDLAGADIDVSRFIREADERHVQVFWRNIQDSPTTTQSLPSREELCSVPVSDKGLTDRHKWRWDHLDKKWVRSRTIYPGLVLMLRAGEGGYNPDLGWTGNKRDLPVVLGGTPPLPEANDDDPHAVTQIWQTIACHTDAMVAELEALIVACGFDGLRIIDALRIAARWHDAGKAHFVFQNALLDRPTTTDVDQLWAKSGIRMKRYERRGFRHELASAISMLQHGLPDLAAYLAAAHHGKVRLSIRSLPHEKQDPDDPERRFARGVWDGDQLPPVDLGRGARLEETKISLSYMEIGDGEETGPSWLARMIALRDDEALGPFRIACLEALLRVADWRASANLEVQP